ncbi:hypothetical protein PACILC2_22770 [Paenibacillus cisolokensis]|uniref:Uncharacterized protein n=1 Tax=Paenibacillus cisolokensis TaxID=1658519 RepID=A0ABQ4N6D7_9BACL|nr:hypothetical protein [Paenibacillus cisolokensis]GIQ63709.1 hypothetical protein PACILC2_22770 [Paenibacillus cisolokensis]
MNEVKRNYTYQLDLQMFADDNGDSGGNDSEGQTQNNDNPAPEVRKIELTQEEFDAKIAERLARERKKYADYDDLKAKLAEYEAAEAERQKAAMTEQERMQAELEAAKRRRKKPRMHANKRSKPRTNARLKRNSSSRRPAQIFVKTRSTMRLFSLISRELTLTRMET